MQLDVQRALRDLCFVLERSAKPAISIIVPVFCERAMVTTLLATLEPFVGLHELIIVDGGSDDGTFELLRDAKVACVTRAPRGRATQMNAGAAAANGHVLLFLHADTALEAEAPELALREIDRGADAGCFLVKTDSRAIRLKAGAMLQSIRSRWWASATGDQAIFVRRTIFDELGGFREDLPICEDLDLVERIERRSGKERFACVEHHVTTSGRRWEKNGINRTIALMWSLRLAYYAGIEPARLAKYYKVAR